MRQRVFTIPNIGKNNSFPFTPRNSRKSDPNFGSALTSSDLSRAGNNVCANFGTSCVNKSNFSAKSKNIIDNSITIQQNQELLRLIDINREKIDKLESMVIELQKQKKYEFTKREDNVICETEIIYEI